MPNYSQVSKVLFLPWEEKRDYSEFWAPVIGHRKFTMLNVTKWCRNLQFPYFLGTPYNSRCLDLIWNRSHLILNWDTFLSRQQFLFWLRWMNYGQFTSALMRLQMIELPIYMAFPNHSMRYMSCSSWYSTLSRFLELLDALHKSVFKP